MRRATATALLRRARPAPPSSTPTAAAALVDTLLSAGARRRFSNDNDSGILHHEWVVNGKIAKDGQRPPPSSADNGTVVFLHGLLGSGKNLRQPAKRLTQTHPNLSALLIDLRGHGTTSAKSTLRYSAAAATSSPQPHTLEACAADVIRTVRTLDLVGPDSSPVGIVGHSFGGRLALQYAHSLLHSDGGGGRGCDGGDTTVHPPRSAWILDAVPGRAHSSVAEVVDKISSVEMPIGSKKELVAELMESKGVDQDVALWMTTNLIKAPDGGEGFVWTFDLDVARDVLDDFPNQDFVGLARDVGSKYVATSDTGGTGRLEDGRRRTKIDIVMAGKTEAWTREVVDELEGIRETGLNSDDPFLRMHLLPDAGHNVHVDDLEGLMRLMEGRFD